MSNQPPDGSGPDYPPTSAFPPVNYAPPGRPPDYGPGCQNPTPPPPPPPRKSNTPLVLVIVAVALLLGGGVVTAGVLLVRNARDRVHSEAKKLVPTEVPTRPSSLPTELPQVPGLPTDLPGVPTGSLHKKINVTYEVTGSGTTEILYVDKLGSTPETINNAQLPWRFSTTAETPTLLSVVAVRADFTGGGDQVTCRVLVDGKEVKKTTSGDGPLGSAACSYFAFG